mgnify:CR=1 FL=1
MTDDLDAASKRWNEGITLADCRRHLTEDECTELGCIESGANAMGSVSFKNYERHRALMAKVHAAMKRAPLASL